MSSIATIHSVLFQRSSRIIPRSLALIIGLLSIIEPGARGCASSLGLSAQTGSGARAVAQEKSDMTQLKLGEGIVREMAGGQSHSYRITLAEGQFLSVVVNQRGIDVVVTLFGPDGATLVEVDTPNGDWGPESILRIIEATGDSQVKIRSLDKDAAPGRYEVKIATLRTATEEDRDLAEAFKFHNESVSLSNKRKYHEAIPPAERALEILEKALKPDRPEIGAALCYLAYLRMRKNDNAVAETLYLRGLNILEKSLGPDHRDLGSPLNNLGILCQAKGDHASARRFYQRALTIRENTSGPEHPRVAATLCNLAILSHAEGDYIDAERLYQRALSIREKTLKPGDPNIPETLI